VNGRRYSRYVSVAKKNSCFLEQQFLQSKRQIRLSRKDHQIVKATKVVSMQYLIPFAVVSVMVLYVLIIASCLCYIGRQRHRTS
jgi:hypothetical protein